MSLGREAKSLLGTDSCSQAHLVTPDSLSHEVMKPQTTSVDPWQFEAPECDLPGPQVPARDPGKSQAMPGGPLTSKGGTSGFVNVDAHTSSRKHKQRVSVSVTFVS